MSWQKAGPIKPRQYTCGHCGCMVGSKTGYYGSGCGVISICPRCEMPTHFTELRQVPDVPYGKQVDSLPEEIGKLYDETRRCVGARSYTAAVLSCRKLLMHIAVAQGAPERESFLAYVEYLHANGYLPPQGDAWVDQIRQKGNEANHEIVLMSRDDAEGLIDFLQMLMVFIYEFPAKLSQSADDN